MALLFEHPLFYGDYFKVGWERGDFRYETGDLSSARECPDFSETFGGENHKSDAFLISYEAENL